MDHYVQHVLGVLDSYSSTYYLRFSVGEIDADARRHRIHKLERKCIANDFCSKQFHFLDLWFCET